MLFIFSFAFANAVVHSAESNNIRYNDLHYTPSHEILIQYNASTLTLAVP